MTDATVPVRSVQNPAAPGSASALLRFFTEIRERTGGDTDLVALIDQEVEAATRSLPGTGPVRHEARAGRLAAIAAQATADESTRRIKELTFLTF